MGLLLHKGLLNHPVGRGMEPRIGEVGAPVRGLGVSTDKRRMVVSGDAVGQRHRFAVAVHVRPGLAMGADEKGTAALVASGGQSRAARPNPNIMFTVAHAQRMHRALGRMARSQTYDTS